MGIWLKLLASVLWPTSGSNSTVSKPDSAIQQT
ncbi:unnamed protein product, partial [marine sediment metagenome]